MADAYHYRNFLFPMFGHTMWHAIVHRCEALSREDPEFDGRLHRRHLSYKDLDKRLPHPRAGDNVSPKHGKRAKRRSNAKQKPRKRR